MLPVQKVQQGQEDRDEGLGETDYYVWNKYSTGNRANILAITKQSIIYKTFEFLRY